MKILYVMSLAGFYMYTCNTSDCIMNFIKIIILIDIIFIIFYGFVNDNIYMDMRNEIITLYTIFSFMNVLPDEYHLGNLLKRYTVHRYGLFD